MTLQQAVARQDQAEKTARMGTSYLEAIRF
jgi:hypothetical protein